MRCGIVYINLAAPGWSRSRCGRIDVITRRHATPPCAMKARRVWFEIGISHAPGWSRSICDRIDTMLCCVVLSLLRLPRFPAWVAFRAAARQRPSAARRLAL